MTMPETLETVLADTRADADVLDRTGHTHDAELLRALAARIEAAAEDFLVMLAEPDARLRSGKSIDWLRARFGEWAADGHAEMRGSHRYYRQCVVPRRPNIEAAREEGRRRIG